MVLLKPTHLLYAILVATLVSAAQSGETPLVRDAAVPFQVGEKLVFEIDWKPPAWLFFLPSVHAGEIALKIEGREEDRGRQVLKLASEAQSSGGFASLAGININNKYQSTVDAETLCSRHFALQKREGKRQQDVEIHFQPERGSLHVRKWDVSKQPPEEVRNELVEDVPPCVQDLLSIFYTIRRMPLAVDQRLPVVLSNDEGRTGRIELRVDKRERVKTDLGEFASLKVETLGLFGGLFRSGGEFKVWLDHERRIPVKFESKVKFGRVSGKIIRYEPRPPIPAGAP